MQKSKLQENIPAKAPAMPKASAMPSEKPRRPEGKQKKLNDGLISAAGNGDIEEIKRLIKKGANIEAKEINGWTALIHAARHGHTQTCAFLLDKGASTEAKDNDDCTALINAAIWGHTQTCILLLEKGADVNAKHEKGEQNGMTSSSLAKKYGEKGTAQFLRSMEWLAGITGNTFMKPFGECTAA